jgi:succinate dehydrogenase / fumarate reductase iron-sulfur subunit
MTRFYDVLTEMKLWTDSEERTDARIHSPKDREQIEHYVDCILCAICYGSCPVNGSRKDYVGPAALAKAWRFYQDTRIGDRARYLKAAKQENGAPLCELIMNCVRACPKGVAPGKAIRLIKAE